MHSGLRPYNDFYCRFFLIAPSGEPHILTVSGAREILLDGTLAGPSHPFFGAPGEEIAVACQFQNPLNRSTELEVKWETKRNLRDNNSVFCHSIRYAMLLGAQRQIVDEKRHRGPGINPNMRARIGVWIETVMFNVEI